MSKVVVVASGKGGVGKTTTSANIAAGLAQKGHKTVAIDFDVAMPALAGSPSSVAIAPHISRTTRSIVASSSRSPSHLYIRSQPRKSR